MSKKRKNQQRQNRQTAKPITPAKSSSPTVQPVAPNAVPVTTPTGTPLGPAQPLNHPSKGGLRAAQPRKVALLGATGREASKGGPKHPFEGGPKHPFEGVSRGQGHSRGGETATAGRSSRIWLAALLPIILAAGIALWLFSHAGPQSPAAPGSVAPTPAANTMPDVGSTTAGTGSGAGAATPTITRFTGAIGGVSNCRRQPAFTQSLGFSRSTLLSTASRTVKGLVIIEPPATGSSAKPRTYQHPSWTMAGYLGPDAVDQSGNIFVAPAPRVNLIDNPPERANIIYKVESATGVMTRFLDLPYAQAPSLTNPFGILGLTYDCDTNSLYATSVAGSTRQEELGRLYRIDLNTGQVASQVNGIDAIGLAVFNGTHGKRLYFGSARTQDVRSIELDINGNFYGQPRTEFSLAGLGPDGNDRARKISFDRTGAMTVNGTKFAFNLAPPPAQATAAAYTFHYDAANDAWTFSEAAASASQPTQ